MAAAQGMSRGMSRGMSQGLFLPCQQHQSEFLGEAAGLGCQGGAVNETPQELPLPFLLSLAGGSRRAEDGVPGRWGVNKHALDVTSEDFNE